MKRFLLVTLLLVVVGIIGVLIHKQAPSASAPNPPLATLNPPPSPSDSSIPLAALADPNTPPEKRVRRVYEMLQTFTMATKSRSRVPLSSNREITRSLTGQNVLGVIFLPPDHPAISTDGELLDPWETPYFFHALAADSWEVVSAGPDRIRFNDDDVIFPPARNSFSLGQKATP